MTTMAQEVSKVIKHAIHRPSMDIYVFNEEDFSETYKTGGEIADRIIKEALERYPGEQRCR